MPCWGSEGPVLLHILFKDGIDIMTRHSPFTYSRDRKCPSRRMPSFSMTRHEPIFYGLQEAQIR
jgi:hypothetical protein